ncbi:MAG: M16 family metallopeptidase [Bacteroidia bacterium]
MRAFYLSFFLLNYIFSFSQNESNIIQKSSNGYTYEEVIGDPLKTRKYILKNGFTVLLTTNKNAPRINTAIAIKAGSKHDPKNNTGLAHYLEHMLFKGTDKYGCTNYSEEQKYLDEISALYEKYALTTSKEARKVIYRSIDSVSQIAAKYAIPNEYDKMVQFIGSRSNNAYTSFDETVYINDIPSNNLEAWLMIEAERFRNPVFRLFHTELEAVYEEKNMSLDSDGDKAFDTLMARQFINHSYGYQTTIGKAEHLKNPSLSAIRKYYDTYYVPNNMALCMSGSFDPDEAIAMIDRYFGNFTSKDIPQIKFDKIKAGGSSETILIDGTEQPFVMVSYRLPAVDSSNGAIYDVMEELLSNSACGLIDENILQKQLATEASAFIMKMHDYSVLFLSAYPSEQQNLEELKNLLAAQMDSLMRGKFTENLFNAAKLNLNTRLIKQLESNVSRTQTLVESFTLEIPLKVKVSEIARLNKLEKSDLVKYLRSQLKGNYVAVLKNQKASKPTAQIEKPEINPVPVNRESSSRFAKAVYDFHKESLKPAFIDYNQSISKDTLKKGVNFWYVANTENELFNCQLIFDIGKMHHPQLELAMKMLDLSGTTKLSAQKIKKELYSLACTFKIDVGEYNTTLSISGPSKSFLRALSTINLWLEDVKLEKEKLASLKKNIKQELIHQKTDADAVNAALIQYATYGSKNPFKHTHNLKVIKRTNEKQIKNLIQSILKTPHTVCYYGTDKKEEVLAVLKKYHAKVPLKTKMVKPQKFKVKEQKEPNLIFTDFNSLQASINWVNPSILKNDTANYSVSLLFNEYFGGGMSSVIFQEIRESKALAYSAYAFYRTPSIAGLPATSGAFIGTQADKTDSAIVAMNRLLKSMPQSESLFRTSKAALMEIMDSERIQPSAYFRNYLNISRQGWKANPRRLAYSEIPKLELHDITKFHQQVMSGKPYTITILGSSQYITEKQLSKYGKVKKLSTRKLFGY